MDGIHTGRRGAMKAKRWLNWNKIMFGNNRLRRNVIHLGLLALLLAGWLPARASLLAEPGQPVVETFAAIADALLASNRPAVNYGSGAAISAGYFSGDGASIYRGLVRFDLSHLPADAVIVSADLVLYADAGTVSKQILARRLTGAWSEASVTWNSQPQSAAPQASRWVGDEAGFYAWNVQASVQAWVSGEQPNHGFLLSAADEAENGYRSFRTREAHQGVPGVDNVRLEVTWMTPVGSVDPGPNPISVVYLPLLLGPSGEPVPVALSPCPELPVWTLLRGMDSAHYQQAANDYGAAGFRPLSVTVEGEGSQARFNVIWVQDGFYGDNWALRHDLTSEELQAEFEALRDLGFRPSFVDAYGQGANTRFAAGWVLDDLYTSMMHAFPRQDFIDTLVYSDTLQGWSMAP